MDNSKRTKGKSITTSVPSIAIRFHTGDEELELYPSADDEEDDDAASATPHPPPPTPPSIPSRDPSPMKEYFRGLGKRSTSVDGAIMDVGGGAGGSSGGGTSDTWRIFHELKGKITKTVEEKLTEMKNDRKASVTATEKRNRLRAGGVDNSSVSDSEDVSETSSKDRDDVDKSPSPKKDVASSLLSPRDADTFVKRMSTGRERNVNFPAGQESPSTSINGASPSTSGIATPTEESRKKKLKFSRKKNKKKKRGPIDGETSSEEISDAGSNVSLPVESGVEIGEETKFIPELEDPDIITTDYRIAPPMSYQPANLARRHTVTYQTHRSWRDDVADYLNVAWDYRNVVVVFLAVVVYLVTPITPFLNGLLIGVVLTVGYHLAFGLTEEAPVNVAHEHTAFKLPDYLAMPVLKVPEEPNDDVLLTTTKCAGWMNELPHTEYDPLTYHISSTQTVYVSLEGSTLRISHPKSKIQKRAAFDEKKYKLKFVHQRIYNIYGCKLGLLPEGLTRKRLWSKKYPICLTLTSESRDTEKDVELNSIYDEKEAEKITEPSSSSLNTLFVEDGDSVSMVSDIRPLPTSVSVPSIVVTDDEDEDDTPSINEMLKPENSDDETFCLVDSSVLHEERLFLFARADRQKEDWYRRFAAAVKYVAPAADEDLPPEQRDRSVSPDKLSPEKLSPLKVSPLKVTPSPEKLSPSPDRSQERTLEKTERVIMKGLEFSYDTSSSKYGDENFIVDSARAMTSADYLEFMNRFHLEIPRDRLSEKIANSLKLQREVDCDVMWLNAIAGHVLYDVLKNPDWLSKISLRIQKKLDTIKRPYFMEDISLISIDLGRDIPLIHRASRPVLDEHGLWVDLDVSFEGNVCLTLETKLNLLKLKKPSTEEVAEGEAEVEGATLSPNKSKSPIFDSDLEDSAESSETEAEDQSKTSSDDAGADVSRSKSAESSPTKRAAASGSKGVLRFMNKIVASKIFQQATENRYIKRAMEGVSNTVITLSVEIRGMTGIVSVNLPPPPSDRLWWGFRGNPQVWIKAQPKFGDRHLNIKHVAKWIEKKLVQEFQKKFVLPNMDDLVIPPMSTQLPE